MFLDVIRVMNAFTESVKNGKKADGFILDLRGNPGGLGLMAMGFGGWFVKEDDLKLGTMHMRDGHINFILNPRPDSYDGPVAILVDGLSASTSEILAGGLQDLKRARIFGSRTAGAALPSIFAKLANGDRFQYAIANYTSVGGKALEGRGVTPDVVIQPQRQALLAGGDPVLDAAVQWIRSQKKTGAVK
jgi:carboxyl-terminal processing protease